MTKVIIIKGKHERRIGYVEEILGRFSMITIDGEKNWFNNGYGNGKGP